MVTGYTASAYGDFIIASLKEPYTDVVKILDWEIIVGLKNSRTTGTISTTANSTVITGIQTQFNLFSVGDLIIIGNTTFEIETIISPLQITVTVAPDFTASNAQYYLPPDNNNYFEYEYRWSVDNKIYSEFRELNKTAGYGDLLSLTLDSSKPLWLTVKGEVAALSTNSSLSILSINYELETVDGTVVSCPQFCTECTDPFAMEGCANILVSCDNDSLFKPYSLTKSTQIYKQLSGIVNDIFGHQVQYFRTEPDMRTKDVILMEYSLHNVVEQGIVKILVPDNEFPEESMTYDIFGMEFAEFEIHIVGAEFESVFGVGKKPRSKDYMYIPIINRMYEISSISLADEFNKEHSYWRVKLVKYQDRTSVIKGSYEQVTDDLVVGIEEVFGEEIQEQYEKDTKPKQFQTVSTSYRDGVRIFSDKGLVIRDYDLKNRWTVVSKNYYDLTTVGVNNTAIEYDIVSKLASTENLALTMWISPQFLSTDTNNYFLIGDLTAITGFKTYISGTKLTVTNGVITHEFNHGITFDTSNWYAIILNINNTFMQVSAFIYMLDPNNNRGIVEGNRPQDSSNNLIAKFAEIKEIGQAFTWDNPGHYHIRGNKSYMTNIRIFKNPIELEQHHNVLNQYVVRDNQFSIIIDNAIPSLGYQKFKMAR